MASPLGHEKHGLHDKIIYGASGSLYIAGWRNVADLGIKSVKTKNFTSYAASEPTPLQS